MNLILPESAPFVLANGRIWPQCNGNCMYDGAQFLYAAYEVSSVSMAGANDNRWAVVR